MAVPTDRTIVPGIVINARGEATVDASLTETLLDLAEQLEGPTQLPVDYEHVVAAIVLASRQQRIDVDHSLESGDPELLKLLAPNVKTVFAMFDGQVGKEP